MENNQESFNRVIAYIRKSSEENERGEAHKQQNSLDYQRRFVKDAIVKHDLKLVHSIFEDDKSAYDAFSRDGFSEMLKFLDTHHDEIDGIVCTEISRLARNFGDGGLILWNMQKGVVKRIYTYTKVFTNSSTDQMMVAIEFAMSKKSSDDTGDRTKQGMRSKAHTMYHPARRPILGYIGEGRVGARKWIIDPKNGPLVKQVFEQYATENFTFVEITNYAYDIGLRSTDKQSTNSKISVNTWRNRLTDIQYTGIFYHEGEKIVGQYEPLILPELFYRVQNVITENEHPKSTHIDYAYSSLAKCSRCGGMLSGTHKKGITYYRCGKKKLPCKDMVRVPYVPENKFENNLINAFEELEIDQETWQEARNYVSELNQPEKAQLRQQIIQLGQQISSEDKVQLSIDRKFASDEISKSDRDRLMEDSRQRMASLKYSLVKCENILEELNELMYRFLDDVKYITKRLRAASSENKRELVQIFCENLVWDDEKLHWDWKKPYFIFLNQSKSSTLLPRLDSNQQPSSYKNSRFTSGLGLCHSLTKLVRDRVYSLYTFTPKTFEDLARRCPEPVRCRSPPN